MNSQLLEMLLDKGNKIILKNMKKTLFSETENS